MNFGTAIIIFFLSLSTLVAEFILYMFFGMGAALSNGVSNIETIAKFFVSLMALTAATGILAPICSLVEVITKKKKVGLHLMLIALSIVFTGLIFFNIYN